MPELTRRRYRERQDCWHVYYGDVHVGTNRVGLKAKKLTVAQAGSGWKTQSPGRIFPRMAAIVQCNCGAEYRRTEKKFLVPHTGDAVCTICGATLESWSESTHVPTYELLERPERKPK